MTDEFSPPAKIWTTLAMAAFVLVVVLLTNRAISRVNQPGVRYPEVDPEAWVLRDFRDAVYYPVRAIADGLSPYHMRTYVEKYPVGQDFPPYSPLTLILHFPFGWLPFQVSQWVYFGLTIGLSLALAWSTLRICGLRCWPASVFGLAAFVLASRPGHMNLLLGQTTIPLVLCSLWALHFAAQRPWLSGLLVAISTFKPTYGVILLVLMFAMGHRRAAIRGFWITALVTAPLALWIVWFQGGWGESLRIWRENGAALYDNPGRDPAHSFSRIDVPALWARWVEAAPNANWELIATGSILALSCIVLFSVSRYSKSSAGLTPSGIFALLVLLIAIYHHAYDAIVLVPILVVAGRQLDGFWRSWSKLARWTWCGLIAIPLANYAATNSFIGAFELTGLAWTIVTSINGAALLLATIWLAGALLGSPKAVTLEK